MYTNETDSMLADGGVMQQGGTVDPVSGNDVPPGAMQEEVRDDIDAKLSEGEFVIPADVVRYIGLSTLMKMRDKAKAGLKKMEEIGQMGNAEEVPNAEALHSEESEMDDETFGSEVDSILNEDTDDKEMEFAEGGYVDPANEALYKSAPLKGFEMVTMVNASGNKIYIPHLNRKPLLAIPSGYTVQTSALPPITNITTTAPTLTTASETSGGGGGGGGADGGAGGGAGGGSSGGGGGAGGGLFGGGFGVDIDPQGNVIAGKSGISSGKAGAIGMVGSMITGIPGLSIVGMGLQKAYTKSAESEAAALRASIADTMGVNANQDTRAATAGLSGTGGAAASAAASAAAAAVAAGYNDEAVGAAAQAAANATMSGANATEAAAVGAAAAATVANDIDAIDASAGYAASTGNFGVAGSNDTTAAADNSGNTTSSSDAPGVAGSNDTTAAADNSGNTTSPGGAPGVAGSNDTTAAADNSGNTSTTDSGGGGYDSGYGDGYSFAKGGFVSKKNKSVVTKSKKGLASRK